MNYKNFNAIVFTGNKQLGNQGFVQYHKQTSLERFRTFLNSKYPAWRFMTLYDRKTNEKEVINRVQPQR